MLVFQTGRLTVKAMNLKNNNGTLTFQKRIPKDLKRFYKPKQEFILIKLTGEHSSIADELAYHSMQTEKKFSELRSHDPQKILELEAEVFLAMFGNKPLDGNIILENQSGWSDSEIGFYSQAHLADLEAEIEYLKSKGKFEEKHKLAVHLLKKPLPLMLSDCIDIYLSNHAKGTEPHFIKNTNNQWVSFYRLVGNIRLSDLNRETAKTFVERRSKEVKTTTVDREISLIRAVINKVILEKNLDLKNPFISLVIQSLGADAEIRHPFTDEEMKLLITNCSAKGDELRTILLIILLTGARLSEICGLRRCDVMLEDSIPNFHLVEYKNRRLKNKQSKRYVPLVPLALDAIKKQLESHNSKVAFPTYCDGSDVFSDKASAALAGFIKRLGIKDKTTHHARHTMRDLLRHADVPPHIQDAIGGWGTTSIGESYGDGYSLKQKMDALIAAVAPIT